MRRLSQKAVADKQLGYWRREQRAGACPEGAEAAFAAARPRHVLVAGAAGGGRMVLAGLVGMCSFQPRGPKAGPAPEYDAPAALRADAAQLGFPIRLPKLPDGWHANSGRRDSIEDGRPQVTRTGPWFRRSTEFLATSMFCGVACSVWGVAVGVICATDAAVVDVDTAALGVAIGALDPFVAVGDALNSEGMLGDVEPAAGVAEVELGIVVARGLVVTDPEVVAAVDVDVGIAVMTVGAAAVVVTTGACGAMIGAATVVETAGAS